MSPFVQESSRPAPSCQRQVESNACCARLESESRGLIARIPEIGICAGYKTHGRPYLFVGHRFGGLLSHRRLVRFQKGEVIPNSQSIEANDCRTVGESTCVCPPRNLRALGESHGCHSLGPRPHWLLGPVRTVAGSRRAWPKSSSCAIAGREFCRCFILDNDSDGRSLGSMHSDRAVRRWSPRRGIPRRRPVL